MAIPKIQRIERQDRHFIMPSGQKRLSTPLFRPLCFFLHPFFLPELCVGSPLLVRERSSSLTSMRFSVDRCSSALCFEIIKTIEVFGSRSMVMTRLFDDEKALQYK
jgi:hypothetical protein